MTLQNYTLRVAGLAVLIVGIAFLVTAFVLNEDMVNIILTCSSVLACILCGYFAVIEGHYKRGALIGTLLFGVVAVLLFLINMGAGKYVQQSCSSWTIVLMVFTGVMGFFFALCSQSDAKPPNHSLLQLQS